MRHPSLTLLLAGALTGCSSADSVTTNFDPPAIPALEDPRGLRDGEYAPCNLMQGTVAMHPSLDTLDLDIGAVIFWVFKKDSVVYNDEDFPASGELVFRGFNIHRISFPQDYYLCMPPGEYVVRAVQDVNHNGAICEPGETWGSIEITHPVGDPEDARILLDRIVDIDDGCPVEETGVAPPQ